MFYVGLDLHKRYITACAIDAIGQLVAGERRLAADLAALSLWLGRLTGPVTVVLEATLYWAWLEQANAQAHTECRCKQEHAPQRHVAKHRAEFSGHSSSQLGAHP